MNYIQYLQDGNQLWQLDQNGYYKYTGTIDANTDFSTILGLENIDEQFKVLYDANNGYNNFRALPDGNDLYNNYFNEMLKHNILKPNEELTEKHTLPLNNFTELLKNFYNTLKLQRLWLDFEYLNSESKIE